MEDLMNIVLSSIKPDAEKEPRKHGPELLILIIEQIDRFLHLSGAEKLSLLHLAVQHIVNTWSEPAHELFVQDLKVLYHCGLINPIVETLIRCTKGEYDLHRPIPTVCMRWKWKKK